MIIIPKINRDLPGASATINAGKEHHAIHARNIIGWEARGLVHCNGLLLESSDYELVTCRCGSDEYAYAISDARGIAIGTACSECEEKLKSKYRPEIFENSNYECDEQIEPD